LLLEVDLGLGQPTGRVSVARSEELQMCEREGRQSCRDVVVRAYAVVQYSAHVLLDLAPVVAGFQRDHAQGAERRRVAEVPQRRRWPRGERRCRCPVALPRHERRQRPHHGQAASGVVGNSGIVRAIGGVERCLEPVAERCVRETDPAGEPLPRGVLRPGVGAVEQRARFSRAPQPPLVQREPPPEVVAGVRMSRCQPLDGGEGRLRFLVSVAHRVRLGQKHRGDQIGVRVGERRQFGAEIRVPGAGRGTRAVKREFRRQRSARVESETSCPQDIIGA
jgi:hypothetical protein